MEPLRQDGDDVLIRVKAVPGASRDRLQGLLGDRLKIAVSAPPEGGKANAAIIKLLAAKLDLAAKDLEMESGHGNALKVVRVRLAQVEDVAEALPM